MKLIRHINYIGQTLAIIGLLSLTPVITSCSTTATKVTLADLKSRYWKGTYYLSVKHSTTSIKCKVDDKYKNAGEVPVTYQGEDARIVFNSERDLEKIEALQRQCFEGAPF